MSDHNTIQVAIQLTVAAMPKLSKEEIIPFFEEAVKSIEKQQSKD